MLPWKKRPKEKVRYWEHKIWAVISRVIRKQHPICQMCGKNPSTQVHHIISRYYKATFYEPDNFLAVCGGCHRKVDYDAEWARSKAIELIGEERYFGLYEQAHKGKKWTVDELKDLYEQWEKTYEELEGGEP
jgi:hypothetical protein